MPLAFLVNFRPRHLTHSIGETWVKRFCQALGTPIPLLRAHAVERTQCSCQNFVLDQYGDYVLTCKKHTGAIAGHDHVINVSAQLDRISGYLYYTIFFTLPLSYYTTFIGDLRSIVWSRGRATKALRAPECSQKSSVRPHGSWLSHPQCCWLVHPRQQGNTRVDMPAASGLACGVDIYGLGACMGGDNIIVVTSADDSINRRDIRKIHL